MALTDRQEVDLIFLFGLEIEKEDYSDAALAFMKRLVRALPVAIQGSLYDEFVEKRIASRLVRQTETTDEVDADVADWEGKQRA